MALETLIYDVKNGVGTVTLNRPDAMNATNDQLYRELSALIREIADDDRVGCVVLTGAGRGFCAGADVKAMNPDMKLLARRKRHRWILADILRQIGFREFLAQFLRFLFAVVALAQLLLNGFQLLP